MPLAAFTATATPRVQRDITDRLGLRDPHMVRASFNRPNLFYHVVPKDNVKRQILRFVREHPGEGGIVYRTTRESVEQTAAHLAEAGVRACAYHAGLDAEVRKRHQDAFSRDEVDVVVATIAFGMGIDKSNVRFVLHGDLPKNVESYYQETGRAGRDGEPAQCVLLFSGGDVPKVRYFVEQIADDAQRAIAMRKLYDMVGYCTVNACRRRQLLGYFGEELPDDNCGACDVCTARVEQVDATTEAQMALSAVARTDETYGAAHVVDIVTGADTQRVRRLGHDRIKTYGVGKDKPKAFWRRLVDDLVAQGCLERDEGEYPVLHLTPKGRDVLYGRATFHVLRQREVRRRRRRGAEVEAVEGCDAGLFDALRAVRTRLAREQNVPPYVVFSDRTLREMARRLPVTAGQMRAVTGVGDRKLERYGRQFLEAIRAYAAEHPGAAQAAPP